MNNMKSIIDAINASHDGRAYTQTSSGYLIARIADGRLYLDRKDTLADRFIESVTDFPANWLIEKRWLPYCIKRPVDIEKGDKIMSESLYMLPACYTKEELLSGLPVGINIEFPQGFAGVFLLFSDKDSAEKAAESASVDKSKVTEVCFERN